MGKQMKLPPRMRLKTGWYYHVTSWVEEGKQKFKWHPLSKNLSEALLLYAERERSNAPKQGETYNDLMHRFIAQEIPQFKAKTAKEWARLAQGPLLDTFDGVLLADITPVHIYGHMDKRLQEGVSVSQNREVKLLRRMFSAAIRWGWVQSNPCRDVELRKEKRRTRYIDHQEYWRVHAAAPPMIQCIMEVGYVTGLRIGDVLALRVSQIRDGVLHVDQQKNEVGGGYPVVGDLKAAIDRARALALGKSSDHIFVSRFGEPYTYYGFVSIFRRAAQRAGVENVHFHDLRGKAATDAKKEGRNVQDFTLHRTESEAAAYVKARERPLVAPLTLPKNETESEQ
jgi:integrase